MIDRFGVFFCFRFFFVRLGFVFCVKFSCEFVILVGGVGFDVKLVVKEVFVLIVDEGLDLDEEVGDEVYCVVLKELRGNEGGGWFCWGWRVRE